MSEPTPAPTQKKWPNALKAFFQSIAENPVILKELRKRMRGRQAYVLLFAYLVIISIFVAIIYGAILSDSGASFRWDPEVRQMFGKTLFGTIVLTELTLIILLSPSLTAGAIASERENQTLDLLRTTLLTPRALVFGKLGSAFSFVFLLIFAAVPLQSLAFLIGGVGMAELIVSSLLLIITAFFFCTLGLFFSSFLKRAAIANTAAYASIVLSILLLGIIFILLTIFSSAWSDTIPETIINILIWVIVDTNPLLTAIISEVLLIDSQSLFFTNTAPLGGGAGFYAPSPWIPFSLIYLALSLIMLLLSIEFVKHPDR